MILTRERDRLYPCHREKKDEFSHRASGDEGLLQLSVQIVLRTTSFSLAGQDLFLKQRDQISPRRPAFVLVAKGETLYTIARRWHTTVNALMQENNMVREYVSPNTLLRLPLAVAER